MRWPAGGEPVLDQAEKALQYRPPPLPDIGPQVGVLEVGARFGVSRGRLDEDFEDQLFALPEDGKPHLIRTARGTHVVLILDLVPSQMLPFEEVRPQVISGIIATRDEAERNELFASLRERYNVVDRSDEADLANDEIALSVGEKSVTRSELEDFLANSGPFGAAHQSANDKARRKNTT